MATIANEPEQHSKSKIKFRVECEGIDEILEKVEKLNRLLETANRLMESLTNRRREK